MQNDKQAERDNKPQKTESAKLADLQIFPSGNKWLAVRISDGCHLANERSYELAKACALARYDHL